MRYGKVLSMITEDNGIGSSAIVTVRFRVYRSVIYEFMDMIIPADGAAAREPIAAILDHSADDVEWAIPEEDMRSALGMAPLEKEDAEQKKSGTTATDDLRRLLDERGVEWEDFDGEPTWTDDDDSMYYARGEFTFNGPTDRVTVYHLTPEQAVAATLGPGTCKVEHVATNDYGYATAASDYTFDLSCGHSITWDWQPDYCPWCGAKVVE